MPLPRLLPPPFSLLKALPSRPTGVRPRRWAGVTPTATAPLHHHAPAPASGANPPAPLRAPTQVALWAVLRSPHH